MKLGGGLFLRMRGREREGNTYLSSSHRKLGKMQGKGKLDRIGVLWTNRRRKEVTRCSRG